MSEFNISQINDLIHSRLRLGIMAYLSTAGSADFGVLKRELEATDGNLSVQITKLEAAGYLKIEKSFKGKKPNTKVILTQNGKQAFIEYIDSLKSLINR